LGVPPNGFPEPLTTIIRKGKKAVEGRPGEKLEPVDFDETLKKLRGKYGDDIKMADVMSYVLYPEVFEAYREGLEKYGDVGLLPTLAFLRPLEPDRELQVRLKHGRVVYITLVAISEPLSSSGKREVYFTANGNTQIVLVDPKEEPQSLSGVGGVVKREKAVQGEVGSVGTPMSGSVVEVRVQEGQYACLNDPLVLLTAMKMETLVSAPISGLIERVCVIPGDSVNSGDLVVQIKETEIPVPLSRPAGVLCED